MMSRYFHPWTLDINDAEDGSGTQASQIHILIHTRRNSRYNDALLFVRLT